MSVFTTPRQAMGWLLVASKGPGPSRPRYSQRVQERSYRDWRVFAALTVLVYGKGPHCCGLVRGSPLEAALREWALSKSPRAPAVKRFESKLRRLLRENGLKIDHPFPRTKRIHSTDEEGHTKTYTALEEQDMPPELTERQRQILEMVIDFQRRKGYSPSLQEIGEAVGITTRNGVKCHLDALQRKGWVRYEPNTARSVVVLDTSQVSTKQKGGIDDAADPTQT